MGFNLIGPLIARNDLAPLKIAIEKLDIPWPEGKVEAVFESKRGQNYTLSTPQKLDTSNNL
jgi:hypothetical protein